MDNYSINKFMEAEYKQISEAHFNVSQRITSFFQYMLAIYGAPLFLLSIDVGNVKNTKSIIFIFISIIGFFVSMYVNQLRCESLLYANSINSIRNYFFNECNIDINFQNNYSVLPIQKRKPSFVDTFQFIWIILTASLVNAGYFTYGVTSLTFYSLDLIVTCFIFLAFFIIQYLIYLYITVVTESGQNFYRHRIGVDIDGVLNLHEKQFCTYINRNKGINLASSQITNIPVRKIPGLGISRSDEQKIFNDRDYWIEMPVDEKASEVIRDIKNILGYEIEIYTWRAWKGVKGNYFNIKKITKKWLKDHHINYDEIYFEHGNVDIPITLNQALHKSRFSYASNRRLKFFVEDEIDKAIKLSHICKYVFLIDHLYNQDKNIPVNVIRVASWEEIYEYLKILN